MNKTDEALKLLDALKVKYSDVIYATSPHLAAQFENGIAGIEQALAAPTVQEPQRYSPDGEGGMEVDSLGAYVKLQDVTTPPEAQPAIVLQQAYRTSDAYTIGFKDGQAAQPAPTVREPVAEGLIRQYIAALLANKPDEAANATKGMVDYVYTTPPAAPEKGQP